MRVLIEIFADDATFGPDPRIELSRMLRSASERVQTVDPGGKPIRVIDATGAAAGQILLANGNRTPGRRPHERNEFQH